MGEIAINFETACKRTVSFKLDLDSGRPHHRAVIADLSNGRLYEPDVSGAMGRILREGDTFVDVGANAGLLTVLGAALVGQRGSVVAFEPGANVLPELRAHITLNGLSNVRIVDKAASDQVGTMQFYLNATDVGGNALWDPAHHPLNVASNPSVEVETTTLESELRDLPVRLIKIDTEGAELLVLRGAGALLAPERVPFVICEFHPFGLEQMGTNGNELRAFMRERGYEAFVLSRRDWLPLHLPAGVTIGTDYALNLLFANEAEVERLWSSTHFGEPY